MSSNDPPLPPTPGEPSDDPMWGSGDSPDETGSGAGEGPPDLPEEEEEEEVPAGTEPVADVETTAEVPASEPSAETDAESEVLPETEGIDPLLEDLPDTEVLPESLAETEVLPEAAAATAVLGETEFVEPSPSAAHRRRVSHRRYVMRRVGVAAGLLAIIGGAIALLVWALGDDDGGEVGPTSTTVAGAAPASSTPTAAVESTDTPTATTAAPEPVATTEATEPTDAAPAPAATSAGQGPDDTETSTESTAANSGDGPETTTPASGPDESGPPGTVVYDLDSEASCEISQELRRGDTGPQVECLQERLNEVTVSGATPTVDGAFGEQTEAAVRAFQEANDLLVDGIVGPTTGELLGIWPNATDAA
jgi:hypothetical protein